MIKIMCFAVILFTTCSCTGGQPSKVNWKKAYDLEKLSYSLNPREFLLESEEDFLGFAYDTLARSSGHDPENRLYSYFGENEYQIPWGIYYTQSVWKPKKRLAVYGPMNFDKISMITNLNNNLLAVGAEAEEVSPEIIDKTIDYLDNGLGESIVSQGSFFSVFYIYTWEDGQSIIKLCTDRLTDRKKDKNLRDGNDMPENMEAIIKENFVHFFLVKKEYTKDIFDKINSGNFLYCDEGDPLGGVDIFYFK